MNIKLYHGDKKIYSTKEPVATTAYPAITITCTLKDESDILNPSFQVLRSTDSENHNYNYVEWTVGGKKRFYIINNRVYESNDIIRLECSEDVLATYRQVILDTYAYVTRSSHRYNPLVTDTAVVTAQQKTTQHVSITNPMDYNAGFYVIGVIQDTDGSYGQGWSFKRGAVAYYTCTESELGKLIDWLQNPGPVYSDYDPMSHIVSCMYIPISETGSSTTTAMFHLGSDIHNWTHTKMDYVSSYGLYTYLMGTVTLPNHPQIATQRTYLNYDPYSKYTLYAGQFGQFEIDRNLTGASFSMRFRVDLGTGDAYLYAYSGDNVIVNTQARIGVDIMLAQQTAKNASQLMELRNARDNMIVGSAIGAAGAIADRNIGQLASIASAINQTSDAFALSSYMMSIPKVSYMNANGSVLSAIVYWALNSEHSLLAGDPQSQIGLPLCEYTKLDNCRSGFTQCAGAHVQMSGLREEIETIDAYLAAGLLIE